jgi:alpha-ketoglutarate-dependent 2,4-dichlorophenoxyacetate dioxygenase
MAIQVKPVLPQFGAEISGVDITRPLDEATQREILAAQSLWGVTVWRDTHLDDESHVAFSRIYGHLELAPRPAGRKMRHERPELFDASNLDAEGNIIDNELIRVTKKGDRLWHTDSSFMNVRSAYSLLLCHEAPPEGGPTWFADTRTAYDDLPQARKDQLEGLTARHSYYWSRMKAGYPYTEEDIDEKPFARHPLVHVHAPSGRKALYIGAHARDIEGMPREEGRALLKELIEHATQPKYVFQVFYKPGDMVIWDNLCSMHRGGDFDDRAHRRDMRRTTVREGAAPETADDPFGDMFRAGNHMAWNQPEPAKN